MIDVQHQLNAVRRSVGRTTFEAREARVVSVSQIYDTDAADLWDACTSIERIPAGSCRSLVSCRWAVDSSWKETPPARC